MVAQTPNTSLFEAQVPVLVKEGMASQSMDALTTGTLLIGLALLLGASPLMVGFLGALPFLANIMQIPAIFLIEKFHDRRRIVLISCWVARLTLLGVALLYFIPSQSLALHLFLILCLIRFMGNAVAGCAWNSWMNDLIPKDRLGRFFSKRMLIMTMVGAGLTYLASVFLGFWEEHYAQGDVAPYALLFALAFLCSIISTLLIGRLHHPSLKRISVGEMTQLFTYRELLLPFRHENFRRLIIFMGIWSFAVNLAAPFFTVFMVNSLGYAISDVIRITVLTQLIYILTLRVWGRYSDMFSNKAILRICGPIFALCFFGWTFTTFPGPHEYTWSLIVILHVLMGAATSGINLASNNIALKLCPDYHSTAYLAAHSLFSSLCGGIAPLVGGALIFFVEDVEMSLDLRVTTPETLFLLPTLNLTGWDFFFFLAFLLAFIALAYLIPLQEEGDAERSVVLRSLVFDSARFIHGISTITGLRAQAAMPQLENTTYPD